MKIVLIALMVIIPVFGFAQQFPDIFEGTWCDSVYGIYETWEKTADKYLKGFSYELKDGEKIISEYTDLEMKGSDMIFTVSVKNQNNEKPVSFVLSSTDSIYTFVNPAHDFPTFINYTIISDNYLKAKVGNKSRSFTLNYHRIK